MSETNQHTESDTPAEGQANHPAPELERGTAGKGFVGVLFAVFALAVIGWLGAKLMAPYPGGMTPGQAADDAKAKTATVAAPETKDSSMAGMPGMSESEMGTAGDKTTGPAGYEARLASLSNESDPICGMTPGKSSNMVVAKIGGKWMGFVSLACFLQYSEGKSPDEVEVLDYSTRQKDPKERTMIPAEKAVYLIEVDGTLPGAMPPGAAAFSSAAEAKAAIGDLGGKITDYRGMMKYVKDWLAKEK